MGGGWLVKVRCAVDRGDYIFWFVFWSEMHMWLTGWVRVLLLVQRRRNVMAGVEVDMGGLSR